MAKIASNPKGGTPKVPVTKPPLQFTGGKPGGKPGK